MLIQRSVWPSTTSSTISTFGASGSCGRAETAPRDRAVRRRRGLGRFGTGTSRLVAQHRFTPPTSLPGQRTANPRVAYGSAGIDAMVRRYIAGHIQRGGGTGPMKPRQPPGRGMHFARRERCQFLTDVAGGSSANLRHEPAEVFSWELAI